MRDAESMLDQLVAFCGNTIGEEDVLNVFGFTAQQMITTLCDHLLSGESPAALAVVHEQAEAGKDLSRLLADLIAHLRNLLVAKADPGGLADELTTEQVAALTAQAERVATDRLLGLIEQFAHAEDKMRWAPNKKMHLEIAVIRAIQMLGQATLSEVLETLAAMRDGGAPPSSPTPAKAVPSAAKPVAKPIPAPRAAEVKAEVRSAEPTAVVRENPPARSVQGAVNAESVWTAAVQTIRDERHPLRLWASSGPLVSIDGGRAVLAFQKEQALAAKNCEESANRKYLEELLTRLAGSPLKLHCELRDQLEVTPVPVSAPAAKDTAPPADPMEEFKRDPLIQKALEIFKAEIAAG